MESCKLCEMIMTEEEFKDLEKRIQGKKVTFMIKRLIDIMIALFLLILFAPFMAVIMLLIIFESGFPVIFVQERMGRKGRVFKILKFRTMRVGSATADGITFKRDKRITNIGAFLRKYRLDEIPQLLNIIKGDMSFVGPRPDLPKYYESKDFVYKAVLLVRPGVTGNATLEFMNEDEILSKSEDPEKTYTNEIFPQKIKMNIRYIKEISVLYDISLLFSTFLNVFLKK